MTASRWTLPAAILGSGVALLDATLVNVIVPRLGTELPTRLANVLEAQSYVYYGYLLSLSALLVLAGALGDAYGRRRMFVLGLVAFGGFSVLCGLATTMEALIAFRVLQGAAGAFLVPGSLAILTAAYEGEARGRAIGIWAGATSSATILGPVLGGLLVDNVSWRAGFLINAPIVVGAVLAARGVTESRDERAGRRFDWTGALVIALAVGGLSFGAIRGQATEWRDGAAYAWLAVGGLCAVVFPWWIARTPHALVPAHLFASRNFTVTNASTLLIYGGLYVTFQYLGLFLIGALGYNAAAAGLAGTPGLLPLVFFSARFGALAARQRPRRFMAWGPTLMALGLAWLARVPESSGAWSLRVDDPASWMPGLGYWTDVFPGMIVFGAGLMILVAPLTTALMGSVSARHAGVASAFNNAVSRVGPQLGGALIFVLITGGFYADLAGRLPAIDPAHPEVRRRFSPLNPPAAGASAEEMAAARAASTRSFHAAMLTAAALCAAGAVVNAVGIRDRATEGESDVRAG
jgi:EmrB/QacA subfamily drug resistance transporter